MKRGAMLFTAVILLLGLAVPAFADAGGEPNVNADSNAEFGQHHAQMAQDGALGGIVNGDMNPGMHQGKSNRDDGCACP